MKEAREESQAKNERTAHKLKMTTTNAEPAFSQQENTAREDIDSDQ